MMYDVVVVGAGPAGSTAAKFLSEESLKVLLIDKDKFPREKPCGGGLPPSEAASYGNGKLRAASYGNGGRQRQRV